MTLVEVPLHAVAHARAGDKGNRSNVSVIPYVSEAFMHFVGAGDGGAGAGRVRA